MRKNQHASADKDYVAYLAQVGSSSLEEAVSTCGLSRQTLQEYFPSLVRPPSPNDKSLSITAPTSSTDYFVFYQENERWAWRRVNQAETIVEVSGGSFRQYAHCIADAKRHGWHGKPWFLFP
jgi:hypothetical protein